MEQTEEKKNDGAKETLIDSVYKKFVRGVTRSIGSTEFYEFFMDSLSKAQNEFQFSNRRLIKSIDLRWVESIEEALEAMQNIIASPRNVIKEDELIVNVAHAKKAGSETVRHLAMHSALVEDFNEETGDVRPGKLMQRYREDTIGLYENRLVYTTMEYALHFVQVRHDALLEAAGDEFGAKLKVKTEMDSLREHVHMDFFMHIKEKDDALETDAKNGDALARISRIYRILNTFMNTEFAQQMAKLPRVSGTINKTNVLKKNPEYRAVLKLWEFLKDYHEVGYTVKVVEQNPFIDERMEENIYRNILFNYLILKGYLEDEQSRRMPQPLKVREKIFKPKVIQEIIEELTEDYDLPDVEIRKIFLEELTKEQLMYEEAKERLRLVEEAEERNEDTLLEERARKRQEREKLRKEQAAEEERSREERKLQNAKDRRRAKVFLAELEYFQTHLEERIAMRRERTLLWNRPQEDFADAAGIMEEAEALRALEEAFKAYREELEYFNKNLAKRKLLRMHTEEEYARAYEERELMRRERMAKNALEKS